MPQAETDTRDLLRMGALAEASGVSAATIKHYLREGLLPEPVKTSRNMAWYSRDYIERIKLIKRLQEERYLPLKVIKRMLGSEPDQLAARLELEDQLLARSHALVTGKGISRRQAIKKLGLPEEVLDAFERIGVLEPDKSKNGIRYGRADMNFLEAVSRFRESGYEESLGFTVYDALIYKRHLEALARDEVEVITERLAGRLSPEDAAGLIERGAEPMRDLISAMHAKLLVSELRRHRRKGGGAAK
ncbi:MAG TPA: MerR family transcriptional regulator [Solirubrobacterales bacterium]|jgi:DNA-binding transcriptional MerR regulator|nr:MerR family transcriptional regulator [Solirubrobacterales bacterium]